MDIAAWLRNLGLERYAQTFRDNEIDAALLPTLTADDLKDLGVAVVGHRRKLLNAIADLREGAAAVSMIESKVESASPRPPASALQRETERRQLTVMFVDLVGSTALSARLDPEDMGAVIRAYQESCAEVVKRWDGHVAKYMGDGVLAYFGWPQAHEDDAERAVRAALALTEKVGGLSAEDNTPLAARAGIATGLVMVGELLGEGAAQEQAVVGDTPNLAARLQALAAPGQVVISQATRRLLGCLFELDDLGPQRLKGFAEPLAAFRVEGEGLAEGRFEALRGQGVTPLVGREHELAMLLERWGGAKNGDGQVVLVSGEPGIGKSRLIRALREELAGQRHVVLSHFCSPHHTNSALHPIIAQLERAAGFAPDDAPAARLAKLKALLSQATGRPNEAVPLLAALLGIPVGDGYPALNLSPQRQKQRTLEVLIEQLAGLARERPVLVLYEDVHWVDPSTLELLDLLIERVRALPALVVLTFRPEFSPPWTGQGHVTALPLSRLGRRQGATIVAQLTKGKPLPTEVQEEIVARTDGIPLFVEELTKTVLESGLLEDSGDHYELGGSLPSLAIPTTLHDSLMARLDRHAPVKEVAQIGAVIGREFSHDLLAAVAPLSDGNLTATLDQLVTSELISRRGAPPKVTYAFKHALVQDVAYQSLLRSKRHQIHARIARALEDHFPTVAAAQPEVLARHLTEAGQSETAIPYWRAAGQHAAERSAFKEAAADIDRGLALLASLPDSAERSGLETGLRLVLGSIQTATKGPAAPEVGQTYARARECCRESGDDAELFAITWNLWHFHAHGSGPHLEEARRLAEELLTLARQRSDPALLLQAHHAAWTTCSRVPGLLATCRDHAEQGVKLYDREQHRTHRFIYGGHDPGVCCRYIGAWASWLLGYPDHAIARATEALDLAEDLAHPLSAILAQSYLSFLHYCRREQGRTWACADRAMALCDEHSIAPHYLAAGRILQGWVLADRGEVDAGLAEAREGLLAFRSTGVTLYLAFILAVLADACGSAGQIEQGLEAVAEALEVIEETGERVWEAEIHRRTGMLLAAQGVEHWPNAEACYERALEVARAQDVKSLELRAATSLAQLWREQGKRTEAQSLLAPIHDWFTEGFDTADLRNAKALLDELS